MASTKFSNLNFSVQQWEFTVISVSSRETKWVPAFLSPLSPFAMFCCKEPRCIVTWIAFDATAVITIFIVMFSRVKKEISPILLFSSNLLLTHSTASYLEPVESPVVSVAILQTIGWLYSRTYFWEIRYSRCIVALIWSNVSRCQLQKLIHSCFKEDW